jgi:hypothetical protein
MEVSMADNDDKKPGLIAGIKGAIKKVRNFGRSAVDAIARFKPDDGGEIDFGIDFAGDTVWATYDQMADLFGVQSPAVIKHVANIYESGELERDATASKLEVVRMEGSRQVKREIEHFNLDMVLAVGYRVNSKRATAFRKWASTVLKGYIEDGYALNGKRLDNDPAALLKLAQTVRSIRTSEKNLYSQVRETFAQCAIDYDKDDPTARTFFASSQDVFHYAASQKTAVEIIIDRADATRPNMGLTTVGNKMPTAADVIVAKNYCSPDELRKMELIGETWLLFAEGMAMQGKQVSMQRLLEKLTELVAAHEFPVFPGYQRGGPRRDVANEHAKTQLQLFKRTGNQLPPPVA